MVQPPARRDAQVRREPAQEVPGHLQRQLGLARTGAASGRRCSTSRCSGSTTACKVFRVDNPHTKPFPFWEWLIERGPRPRPRRHVPRRGVHPARDDAGRWRSSASASPTRTSPGRTRAGSSPSTSTSSRTASSRVLPPQLLRQHARHPPRLPRARRAARVRSRGSCWPRRCRPSYGIYSGFEHFENVPVARGLGGVPGLREVRDQASARSTARCCRSFERLNRIRRENPALQQLDEHHVPRDGQRRAHRLRQAARGNDVIIVVVNLDPHHAQEGLAIVPAQLGLPPAFTVARPADAASGSTGGSAATTSGSTRAAGPRPRAVR